MPLEDLTNAMLAEMANEHINLSGGDAAQWQPLLPHCPAAHLQVT